MPIERAEVATLKLAQAAGIRASPVRLELADTNRPVALIKRFDRSGARRFSYLSAQSFLGAEAATGAYYSDIADSLRAHALAPREQMAELYRRILFTILVSNTDDHLKNHGLLHAGGGRWTLSPAFDVNPQPIRRRELETGISELSGNTASIEAAIEASPLFGIARDMAVEELSRITSTIEQQWQPICLAAGMTVAELELYRPAFDHDETPYCPPHRLKCALVNQPVMTEVFNRWDDAPNVSGLVHEIVTALAAPFLVRPFSASWAENTRRAKRPPSHPHRAALV